MALSGPEAMKSLDDAIRDIRGEEDDISKRLARSAERIGKMHETETALFVQLAGIRLDPAHRDEIAGRLTRAEEQARAVLDAHAQQIAGLDDELAALDAKIAGHARTRRDRLAEVDTHQAELKALAGKISATIEKDPDYVAQRKAAEDLREVAAQSMSKTEQAEADRDQKGKPYRDDVLFMYLWEAGYGTKTYNANNLIRWLDSIIARMVGYQHARPNFAMLNEIPLRLKEHADRQAEAAQKAEAALDAKEAEAIDKAGGKPVREALAAAQAAIEKIDAEMVALEDERDEKANLHRQLAEGHDPKVAEVNRSLATSLQSQDIAVLLSDAKRTATGEDDAIIAKIGETRSRIAEEEEDNAEDKARLKVLATRRRELEFEFKKSRFDDPRSVFREDNLAGDLLGEFLRGAITAATYWGAWQQSQRWRPGTTDWGGGFGLPNSGRSRRSSGGFSFPPSAPSPWSGGSPWGGSSGGFSRPRTGSRGTRRSGGFKTGGGF